MHLGVRPCVSCSFSEVRCKAHVSRRDSGRAHKCLCLSLRCHKFEGPIIGDDLINLVRAHGLLSERERSQKFPQREHTGEYDLSQERDSVKSPCTRRWA